MVMLDAHEAHVSHVYFVAFGITNISTILRKNHTKGERELLDNTVPTQRHAAYYYFMFYLLYRGDDMADVEQRWLIAIDIRVAIEGLKDRHGGMW